MIRLYNTKTLQIEEFKPIHEGHVDMYVCGPTVYNYAHIGNARPMIVFDVLKRLFEAEGYSVTYVSNFTDVDDKIIKKAAEENTTEAVIAQRYIDAYQEVRTLLNTELPDIDVYKRQLYFFVFSTWSSIFCNCSVGIGWLAT